DHRLVNVHAYILFANAWTATTPPGYTVKLVSITSSEADNGLGDGDQPYDIQTIAGQPIVPVCTVCGTAARDLKVRAERSGTGPGRVYTITYQISNAGGSTTVSAKVLVPHDMTRGGHFDGDGCRNNRHWDSDLDGDNDGDGDDRR